MKETFPELVYLTMTGQLIPECRIAGVEDIFVPGKVGLELYKQASDAYKRICKRLGVQDEDDDLEIIMCSMMDYQKEVALRMYEYGAQFGRSEK